MFQTNGVLRCELGKQSCHGQANLRLLIHAAWRATELPHSASERDCAVDSGGATDLNGTREQGGGVSVQHDGRAGVWKVF